MNVFDVSQLIIIIGVLTLIVNVITEVCKQTFGFKNEIPAQLICFVVSIASSVVAFIAYCQMNGIIMTWYSVVASVVLGFFVAYSAMFGYDKLKEIIEKFTKN